MPSPVLSLVWEGPATPCAAIPAKHVLTGTGLNALSVLAHHCQAPSTGLPSAQLLLQVADAFTQDRPLRNLPQLAWSCMGGAWGAVVGGAEILHFAGPIPKPKKVSSIHAPITAVQPKDPARPLGGLSARLHTLWGRPGASSPDRLQEQAPPQAWGGHTTPMCSQGVYPSP